MGGRLTEFDQYEMLDGWGTPRPVYGPKHSAVPIGSHLDNDRPRLPQQVINVGRNGVGISLDWNIANESKHTLQADYRIRLVRRRGVWGDEDWFEYRPGKGVTKDIVADKTGKTHKIITTHGWSWSTNGKTITIPGNKTKPVIMGITIPGPAQGRDMEKFWKDRKESTFNLLIAVYQRVGSGFEELDRGEHEFEDILELNYDPSVPPTRVTTPYTGPTAYELPGEAGYKTYSRLTTAERGFSTDVYQGPTTELPAIPYGKWDRTTEIPAWAQKHWDDPSREKVPTRTTRGGFTVQTYDPDTGDPW